MGTAVPETVNEVRLVGRVSGDPEVRHLPSGTPLAGFRVVVPRPLRRDQSGTPAVDTIQVTCWDPAVRRTAGSLRDGDMVEVRGQLRRHFFAAGAVRASRYEVEACYVQRRSTGSAT